MMADSSRLIDVESMLICDDIRREDNGKLIVIGVYQTGINLVELPGAIILSALLTFKTRRSGQAKISIEFRESWSDRKIGADITLQVKEWDERGINQMVYFTGMPFQIPHAGDLKVFYKYEDEDWEFLRNIPITAETSSDPAQPS